MRRTNGPDGLKSNSSGSLSRQVGAAITDEEGTIISSGTTRSQCSKLIVASGIRRVVYREPYPKSLTARLFDDSIAVDGEEDGRIRFDRLTGIAPQRFQVFFAREKQFKLIKPADKPKAWRLPCVAQEMSEDEVRTSINAEDLFLDAFNTATKNANITT